MARQGPVRANAASVIPAGFNACPVNVAFEVVGKKWTVLLIRNMLRGQSRFNEFLANIPGINPKILSARLKELEAEGIIVKRVRTTKPVAIEYALTEKGFAVLPILRQMVRWSLTWAPDRVLSRANLGRDVERCMQEWQTTLMADDPTLVMDWKPEIVTVRHTPKRRT
jgi:DNA-binding HxlR family transcriptional regulator